MPKRLCRLPRSKGGVVELACGAGETIDRARALNTRRGGQAANGLHPAERAALLRTLEPDVRAVERLLRRELPAWRE